MPLVKEVVIRKFRKQLKVTAYEYDGGEMVSGCEYRRRATARQVEFEANKWEKLGYATTIKESNDE
jgi:isopentenyldiphosphate isomerase